MYKKVDAEGKPIIHGRFYAYDPHHSWIGLRVGRIIWHRTLLVYLFEDNNPTFKPVVVNFQNAQDDWTTLVARDFVRFNSKPLPREVSKEEEVLGDWYGKEEEPDEALLRDLLDDIDLLEGNTE